MTEVERYETKGKANKNTKVSPQQQWMDLLASSVDSCPAHLKHHFQTMASLDNVPRKEKQFRNFAQNSLHLHSRDSENILTEIWKYLMAVKEQQRDDKQATKDKQLTANVVNKQSPIHEIAEEVSQAKPDDITTTNQAPEQRSNSSDNLTSETVKKAMKCVLKDAKDNVLPIKKLRKTLRKNLGISKSGKDQLKHLVKANLTASKFIVKDKTVRLQVK
jgi:hypothetical protein